MSSPSVRHMIWKINTRTRTRITTARLNASMAKNSIWVIAQCISWTQLSLLSFLLLQKLTNNEFFWLLFLCSENRFDFDECSISNQKMYSQSFFFFLLVIGNLLLLYSMGSPETWFSVLFPLAINGVNNHQCMFGAIILARNMMCFVSKFTSYNCAAFDIVFALYYLQFRWIDQSNFIKFHGCFWTIPQLLIPPTEICNNKKSENHYRQLGWYSFS